MIKKLFFVAALILGSSSYAADNKVNLADINCGSGDVLFNVAQGLSTANNISNQYGYDFVKMETVYRSPKKEKFNLRCSANVNLINAADKSIVQS